MVDLGELAQYVIDGHADNAARLTQQAVEEGIAPGEILEDGLIAAMAVVGERFREHVIFLPEMLVAARAMKAGMAILEPILAACGIAPRGKILLGTVRGDIHDIGKNLVAIMLKGAGFEIVDLGTSVPLPKFIAAIEEHRPDLVGMSALLTTTMTQMKVNIDGFRAAGLFDRVRVIVGGAPVTADYARSIGAHGHAKDAPGAVEVANRLLEDLRVGRAKEIGASGS